jgi:hypothetical protein
MNRKERKQLRNERIKKGYEKLKSVKEHGVSKHSYEWMVNELAEQWCLAPFTIEKIIQSK